MVQIYLEVYLYLNNPRRNGEGALLKEKCRYCDIVAIKKVTYAHDVFL